MNMDTEYFAQRLQCSRNDKEECLQVIPALAMVVFAAQGGVRALNDMLDNNRNWQRRSTPFLNKSVQLYMDAKNAGQIRRVLYNTVLASNFSGPQFLQAVIVTEVMASLFEGEEDINFIFHFLVPSLFGIEYEAAAVEMYEKYKRSSLRANSNEEREEVEFRPK